MSSRTKSAAPARLPSGTVTFLLTDIEGSTRLWEKAPAAMEVALERHNLLLADAIAKHGGVMVTARGEGDSFFAAFPSAVAAVESAGASQRALSTEQWPIGAVLRVRMGLHTGEVQVHAGDYVDHTPINRCARVKAAAHGGQVLLTKATSDLVHNRLGSGLGLKRLGGFRLRDLVEPELIYQLTHPDLDADFPPIRTSSERTSNLPLQVSSFVGRSSEVEQTEAVLGRSRVVTLTGPGGVGKTRLALEVAGELAPRFTDGAWLCELAAVRDAAMVDDAVAAVFSLTAPGGQSTREALDEFLHGKQVLLALDNCEHVLAAAASLARDLISSCERVVILATSREGLGIDGERLVPLAPLPVPAAGADLAQIERSEAVQLFAERAAAVKPGFEVTAANAQSVARVVRRLDGVALAIELAAARTPSMTPAELAIRLDRSFAVLAARGHAQVQRHQTLRATIDWSFQLLSEPEKRLLCRLAVFAGDAALDAVEAVCGGDGVQPDEVLDLLDSLVARSLVVAEEHGPRTRYRLLETLRQYGEERLAEASQLEQWRTRHARYYADLLKGIRVTNPEHDAFWALRLGVEQDNLLAGWSWAISTGNIDTAFEILAGFAPCEVWSTYPSVLPGEAALELPGAVDHPRYPLALAVSAVFASSRADTERAEDLCRQALAANDRPSASDWRVDETVLAARANVATLRGEFSAAARLHEQAAELARTGGDLADTSVELTVAVACHVLAEDAPSGVPLSREALAVARGIGAPSLIATALLEVGATLAETDPDQARACLRESREISEALGYHRPRDLVWAAGISFLLHDRVATLELGAGAVRSLQRSGNRLLTGIALQLIAGTIATSRSEAAAIIMGAAETRVIRSSRIASLVGSAVVAELGEQQFGALRARGADLDWDEAIAFALAQATEESAALAQT